MTGDLDIVSRQLKAEQEAHELTRAELEAAMGIVEEKGLLDKVRAVVGRKRAAERQNTAAEKELLAEALEIFNSPAGEMGAAWFAVADAKAGEVRFDVPGKRPYFYRRKDRKAYEALIKEACKVYGIAPEYVFSARIAGPTGEAAIITNGGQKIRHGKGQPATRKLTEVQITGVLPESEKPVGFSGRYNAGISAAELADEDRIFKKYGQRPGRDGLMLKDRK